MSRSTVKRSRLARRIREKSAAAVPVICPAFRTERPRPSSTRMIRAARMERSCSRSALARPKSRKTFPLPRNQFKLLRHVSISFSRRRRSRTRSMSCPAVLNAGRRDEGEARARESLAMAEQMRDRGGRVFGVGLLARLAAERGHFERAGRLWGAIESEDAVAPLGGWRRHRQRCEERIRAAAGPDFERGYAAGRAPTLDDAVALALIPIGLVGVPG